MQQPIPSNNVTVSLPELQADPLKVVANAQGQTVAVLDHNQPVFYCVPAEVYEAILERLDDMALLEVVNSRIHEPTIKITLDEL